MEPFYLCNTELFGLANSTAVVYTFLCKVNNVSTGKSYYKRANIAKACHVSVSTVVRALRTLCDKGLLEIKRKFDHGRQIPNDYILIDNPQIKLSQTKPDAPEADNARIDTQDKNSTPDRPRLFPCRLDLGQFHLNAREVKVYSYLSLRAGENGSCMPSKKEIAADCGISVSTVGRAIKALKKSRLIEILPQTRLTVFGNNGTSVNQYVLKKPEQKKPSEISSGTVEGECSVTDTKQSRDSVKVPEMSAEAKDEALQGQIPFTYKKKLSIPSVSAFRFFRLPPYQIHFFDHLDDTLPHVSHDTLRTRSRKKATINLRELRPFTKIAQWYDRAGSKLAGWLIRPAKLE